MTDHAPAKLAPILLFAYNRPRHMERTLRALRENELARECTLIIRSDGPKDRQDEEGVRAVREQAAKVDGFREVLVVESEMNCGLADSIIKGVTETVDRYGSAIVLEDDLVTSPGFLRFMNEALCAYADEKKVMQIAGYMFDVRVESHKDAIFMPFTSSWGWATWKRAWDHFDPLMSGYEELSRNRSLRHRFDLEGAYDYFGMLQAEKAGKIDSWAIRWYLSVFMMDGLALYPSRTLVENTGFDRSGTHRGKFPSRRRPENHAPFPGSTRFPEATLSRTEFDQVRDYLRSHRSFSERLKSALSGFGRGRSAE